MSNDINATQHAAKQTANHFDLHTTGIGYLNRAREVKPQTGKKFKPFWSVGISALHGNADEVEYSRIDTTIVGVDARELVKQYKEVINQQDSRVLCGFKVGDIYADPYKSDQGEIRAVIKGRLLYISWIKVNGEIVYKAEKPQTTSPEKPPEVDPQQQESSVLNEVTTQNTSSVECPFDEQLGNQVTVLKNDPDFDKKTEWLTIRGYEYDASNDVWNLPQQ